MSVNKSYLLNLSEKELEEFKKEYPTCSMERLRYWGWRLGYANSDKLREAVRKHLDIQRDFKPQPKQEKEEEIERNPIINLPPVNLLKPKLPKKGKGDEEIALLLASDGHADKITQTYNKDVYKSRMGRMFESVMTIVNLHRNMYPIRKLVIANAGDNVQGENPYQGSTIGQVSMGARDQVKILAAPMWNDMLGSFKQEFQEVEFHGVPGNHGHDKLAPETSSYDLLLYDVLDAGIGHEKGININVHDLWYHIFKIYNFRFFLFHGDGIPCIQGVPFFALDKKLKSWYMQFGGFEYALGGHFHKRHTDEISSRLEYFMSSTLVTDDDWAQKKMGISSNPSQWLMGVHPKHGITWRYALIVDDKFLPEVMNG